VFVSPRPARGESIGRLRRPSSKRTPKRSFGYRAAPGEGASQQGRTRGEAPSPQPSPRKRGEGVRAPRASDSIFRQPIPDTRPPSRDATRPRFCNVPPRKSEGVGNAGCPLHPQPRVQKVESTRVSTADTPEHPAFPHAMVLTVSFVLSQATGLVCHLRRRNEAPLMSPVGQEAPSAALTPASGRQDHTTSPSAGHIIRLRAA
jgi:hypothetical protein